MLILVLFLTILLFPPETSAHPGKTNYQGGHRCLKECEEWNLYYAEYHLHDKDGKPIRVAAKKKVKKQRRKPVTEPFPEPAIEAPPLPAVPVLPRPMPARQAPPEEPCLASLPGGLLVLLLLLLLAQRRKARRSRLE